MTTLFVRFTLYGLLFAALIGLNPQTARAAGTWYVATTGSDANACAAVGDECLSVNGTLAKAGFVAGDTIKVASGYYFGSGNEVILITKNVTISGGWNSYFDSQTGVAVFRGEDARRGLTMDSKTVTLDHVAFQNGLALGDGGGGIFNYNGKLTILDSWIGDNAARSDTSTGYGGGILSAGSEAELTLNDSTIQGSLGESDGGGLFLGGKVRINRSMIVGNAAGTSSTTSGAGGGGISFHGGGDFLINESSVADNFVYDGFFGAGILAVSGTVVINNSTIANNRGGDGIYNDGLTLKLHSVTISGNDGVGLSNQHGTVEIANTLIAQNDGGDCYNGNTLTSLGYNLVQTPGSCVLTGNDLTNVYPFLGYFNPNGGPTYTTELYNRSPAIDAGNPAGCADADGNPLTTDQRGAARIGTCDIGAFEFDPAECSPYGPDLYFPFPNSTVHKRKLLFDWYDQRCVTSFTLEVRKNSKKGAVVVKKENLLLSEVKVKLPIGASKYAYQVTMCYETVCKKSDWYKFTYQP